MRIELRPVCERSPTDVCRTIAKAMICLDEVVRLVSTGLGAQGYERDGALRFAPERRQGGGILSPRDGRQHQSGSVPLDISCSPPALQHQRPSSNEGRDVMMQEHLSRFDFYKQSVEKSIAH